MAKFITTTGISHHIETIINKATKELYLISPYLKISQNFQERLKDAAKKGVSITIVYGKVELKATENILLKEIPNLKVFYLERLHAKCYLNEREMVITSMNMYEFSEKNNREMGVLIHLERDEEMYNEAKNEILSIINHSRLKLKSEHTSIKKEIIKSKPHWETDNVSVFVPTIGYCISCENQIRYDLGKPYCDYCYEIFLDNNIPLEGENFCHRCKRKAAQNEINEKNPNCRICEIGTEKERLNKISKFLNN